MARYSRLLMLIGMSILSVAMIALAVWLIISALDRSHPVNITNIRVINPKVQKGKELFIAMSLERNRICTVYSSRMIYDSTNTRVAYYEAEYQIGGVIGRDKNMIRMHIPEIAATGPAIFKSSINWICPRNVIHKIYPIKLNLPDINFEITE